MCVFMYIYIYSIYTYLARTCLIINPADFLDALEKPDSSFLVILQADSTVERASALQRLRT
jgi:hypothetical protein